MNEFKEKIIHIPKHIVYNGNLYKLVERNVPCVEEIKLDVNDINPDFQEKKIKETLFEKITKDKKSLAEYLLKCCDNPLFEVNEDMCDFCDKDDGSECDDCSCMKAIIKGLDSEVK